MITFSGEVEVKCPYCRMLQTVDVSNDNGKLRLEQCVKWDKETNKIVGCKKEFVYRATFQLSSEVEVFELKEVEDER